MRSWAYGAAAVLVLAGLFVQFAGKQPIEADLLALLPDVEQNPVVKQAEQRLSALFNERMVFLLGNRSDVAARKAAAAFRKSLEESSAFKTVHARVGAPDPDSLIALYAGHQNGLLAPADAQALADGREALAAKLLSRLASPFPQGAVPVAMDPFGFLGDWLAHLPYRDLKLQVSDGWLTAKHDGVVWVLVSTVLAGSPFTPSVEEASLHAVDAATAALQREYPDTTILRAGTVFHSAAIRKRAVREIDFIGGVSLAGIIVLLASAFRSGTVLGLGLLSVSAGIAAGLLTTIVWYGRIHLLTLVFGASLLGEAVDYSIQYFSVRLGAGENWEPRQGLRHVSPRLAVALLTSVLGYAALTLTPFPVLSQIGVFAIAGLLASVLTVVLVFPAALRDRQRKAPARLLRLASRINAAYRTRVSRASVAAVILLILAVSAFGMTRLASNDDIKLFVSLSPALIQEEQRVRELAGVSGTGRFLLIEGATDQEVLEREEDLRRRLARDGVEMQGVSSFVPSCKRQTENRALYRNRLGELKSVMSDAGFTDAAVSAMDRVAGIDGCMSADAWLASPLSRPFAHLWIGKTANGHASVALPSGPQNTGDLDAAVRAVPGAVLVDKPAAISALMGKFRRLAAWALIGAIALVYFVLALRYGPGRGGIVLLPTILSLVASASLLGYLAVPLTLFHVLAFLLVVGVGVNYAIFLVEGADQKDATTLGVLLSVLTTLLSFGLLAFSSMPAAHHFGATLAIGLVGVALLSPISLVLKEKQ